MTKLKLNKNKYVLKKKISKKNLKVDYYKLIQIQDFICFFFFIKPCIHSIVEEPKKKKKKVKEQTNGTAISAGIKCELESTLTESKY